MADAARDVLWHWIDEADDPDPELRSGTRSRLDGILLACRRTGLLTAGELARWQALIDGAEPAMPAGMDPRVADAHLEERLRSVRPMTVAEDPARVQASERFQGALRALTAAGVIGDDEALRWHKRELLASAPWLPPDDVEQLIAEGGYSLIGIPPSTPEEEAAAAAGLQAHERLMRRGALSRVVVRTTPERHDGLAVFGIVLRSECTEVLFHLVPPPGEPAGRSADLSAFAAILETLVPPGLSDDVGTFYEPVIERPVSSHGTSGPPDTDQPRALTGYWRYLPAAPESARSFAATLGNGRWAIP